MKCPHCKTPLLDGEESCYRCGRALIEISIGTRFRPAAITALAFLGVAVAVAALAAALWLALPESAGGLDLPLLAPIPAGYALLRLRGAFGLWRLEASGRTLQIVFSYLELLLFPFGTILSIFTLLYLGKPEIEALFRGQLLEDLETRQRRALRETRDDSVILAVTAAGCAVLALAAVPLALGVRGFVRESVAEAEAEFPHCREELGVSTAFTERWRLPLDRPGIASASNPGVALAIDSQTTAGGGGSLRITTGGPTAVWLTVVPVHALRLDGGTLFFRARVLDRDLDGQATLGLDFSETGPGPVMEPAPPDDRSPRWRDREVVYIPSAGEETADVVPNVLIQGSGTVWIDDLRLLRGPPWRSGPEWRRAVDEARGKRPGSGVEHVYEVLTGDEEAAQEALLDAFAPPPAGAVPPDRVQRCLTELALFYPRRREPGQDFLSGDLIRRDLLGRLSGRRLRPSEFWIWDWLPVVYSYRQPDYLPDLVRHASDEALVATYGREVVPHLLAHADELMEPTGIFSKRVRRASGEGTGTEEYLLGLAIRMQPSVAVADMVGALLDREQAGELRLEPEERAGLRELLEGHFERVRREAGDALLSPHYDRLLSVLGRLGSKRLRSEALPLVERRLETRSHLGSQLADLWLLTSVRPEGGREILEGWHEGVEDPEVRAHVGSLLDAWDRDEAPPVPTEELVKRLREAPPLAFGGRPPQRPRPTSPASPAAE